MSDQTITPPEAAASPPPFPDRPKFRDGKKIAWGRAIECAVYPLIRRYIGGKRRPDGTYPGWILALPDGLTKSRLATPLLTAGFVAAAMLHSLVAAIACLVGIAALFLTDAFDGAIARFTENTSPWGERWDPVIDKIALAPALVGLLVLVHYFQAPLFWWFMWFVVARVVMDVILGLIARTEEKRNLKPKSGMWGKVKTTCDILAVLVGYAGATTYAAQLSGAVVMLVAGGFLALATFPFAPGSIIEHAKNLRRNRES